MTFAAFSTAPGWGSALAARQPSALVKVLGDADRYFCHSFKVKCKARSKTHAVKPQKPVSDTQKAIELPATPAKSETIAAKSTPAPPIPAQKPIISPKVVALAPVKAAGEPPIPIQKPVIATESVTPAPVPRAKPQAPQKQAALIPRVLPKDTRPSDDDATCLQRLRIQGVEFTIPVINVDSGQCHVQNPVILHSVKAQQNSIKLPEGPLLNCKFALQFSKWLSESGAPILAAQLGTPLEKLSTGPGFECRGRNGDSSAKISEHGFGNAIDITTLRMHDGKVIEVQEAINPNAASYPILRGLRMSACGYFTTVLGPGSNSAHEKHFHFDLGVHGKSANYRICE